MQRFEWKRKHSSLRKESSPVFSTKDAIEDKDEEDVDWLEPVKRPKVMVLEDGATKAERLKKDGVILAEANKWWSAIKQWGAAISYQPTDHTLHEMMAQAYMQVGEFVPSIQRAEESVKLAPMWWCGHQTLGRALMGIGELHRAVICFSASLRLNPDNPELREHDLKWASQLLASFRRLQKETAATKQKQKLKEEAEKQKESEESLQIVDLKENPEAFKELMTENDVEDSTSAAGVSGTKSSLKSAYSNRSSISENVRFISCCSSNKSGKSKVEDEQDRPNNIDLSEMVCMRPKFPSR